MAPAIEVARCQDVAFVKVTGLGNFNNAAAVREWVETEIQAGARRVVLDFSDCNGLDSTFMGTMMGFLSCPLTVNGDTQKLSDSCVALTVLNASAAALRAMTSLGLQAVMDIKSNPVTVPDVKLRLLNTGMIAPQQRIRLIREAHENLVRLDPANEKIFAPFLEALLKGS
ncbi:MAG: STAS domain-containing protein [Planctomycetes bacterium]|nr:STAS domain-containing protein [Planctomycetota bacterium]